MVQAPPKPTEPPTQPEINIELDDLQELARINPLAWEQLLHIADNRKKDAQIADLQAHLDFAHKERESVKTSSLPGDSVKSNGLIPEVLKV